MASAILLFLSCLPRFIRNPIGSDTQCLQIIQQRGQQLYQDGEYQKAYRLFVGLQELQRQHWGDTCRRRQAHHQQQQDQKLYTHYQLNCLLHLGKHQEALNLCYTILKTSPSSIWYLLAADIYIQGGRLGLALDAVRKSHSYLLCEGQQNEISLQERILYEGYLHQQQQQPSPPQQQHTPAHLDMVEILSYDIVCSIFMLLPLKSFVLCSRVNSTWRSLILTNPLFWQHLSFYENRLHPLPTTTIQLYLSRLHGAPLLSLLVQDEQDAQDLLKCLCQSNCSRLSELDWMSFGCTTKECWPLFRQVIFSAGKTLTKLRLGSGWFKLNDLIDLVSAVACPCLTTLDLYDCYAGRPPYNNHDDNYDDNYVNGTFLAHGVTLPPLPLRHLGLSGVHGLTALYLGTILLRCPHLIELTLHNSLVNTIPILHLLSHACPRLQQFSYHQNRSSQLPISTTESRMDPSMPPSTAPQQHTSIRPREDERPTHDSRLHQLFTTTATAAIMVYDNDDDTRHAYWKQLTLKQTPGLTDGLLHTILTGSYHTIQTLDLKDNPQLTDYCIFNMMIEPPLPPQQQPNDDDDDTDICALPSLEECSFADCLNITEVGLCLLLEHAPRLWKVDLSGLSGVTDIVLLSMALSCPHLSILRLVHCRSITDDGMRCFIDTFSNRNEPQQQPFDGGGDGRRLLQELDLTDTNLSMECLAYVMCHIRRDGI